MKPKLINHYLEVLPTAATRQILHNEAVLGANRRAILFPSSVTSAAVTTTFVIKGREHKKILTTKKSGKDKRHLLNLNLKEDTSHICPLLLIANLFRLMSSFLPPRKGITIWIKEKLIRQG